MSRRILRSLAGQLLVYALLVEANDPATPDLDNRYACLPGLAHDVPRRVRVAFYVDLLERDFALFEVTLHTLALPAYRLAFTAVLREKWAGSSIRVEQYCPVN